MAFRFNVEKARAAGLSDIQIQQMIQAGPPQAQTQAQPQQQGFNLADLLPIAGAIGGSFLPGLGTIAGGALGAGAGTLLRQGVKQQPLDVGEAGKEALFAGAGGAIGGKLLGPLLGKLGSAGTRAATIAPKSGIAQFGRQEAVRKTASLFPKLRGSGAAKFQNVEKVIEDLTGQVDDLFKGVKTTIPSQTFGQRASAIESTLTPNDARAFRNVYNRTLRGILGDKLPSGLNANQVNAIKRAFNKQASAAYRSVEKGGVLSAPNQAVIELKDFTDDILTQLAPQETKAGVNLLNQQMRDLIEGIPEFKALSEQGLSFFGVRPPGAGIPSQLIQSAQDIGGRVAGGLVPQATRAGVAAGAALGGGQPQEGQIVPGGEFPSSAQAGVAPQQGQNMQDIFRMLAIQDLSTGGKNISKIIALSNFISPPPTETQKGQVAQIQAAEGLIDQLSTAFGSAQSAGQTGFGVGPISGLLGGITGGAVNQEATLYGSLRKGFTALIARATGERGVLTDADAQRALSLLPSLNDSPQLAQNKLDQVREIFRNAQARISQGSNQGSIPFPSDFSSLGL